METVIIQGKSKKAINLLIELSRQLNLKQKKFTTSQLEDFLLALRIDEGREIGYTSKQQVLTKRYL